MTIVATCQILEAIAAKCILSAPVTMSGYFSATELGPVRGSRRVLMGAGSGVGEGWSEDSIWSCTGNWELTWTAIRFAPERNDGHLPGYPKACRRRGRRGKNGRYLIGR